MKMTALLVCLFAAIGPQSATIQTGFDTVHIEASKNSNPAVDTVNLDCTGRCAAGLMDQGRVVFGEITMLRIIASAYGIKPTSVYGGPSWLATDRFDIYAKTDGQTSPEKLQTMFQSLLAERFGLAVHWEDKPMPSYSLQLAANRPRFPEASGTGPPACKNDMSVGVITLNCQKQTMAELALLLSNSYLPASAADDTGLKGVYDFTLSFRPVGVLIRSSTDPRFNPSTDISIFDALRKLGLKLEQRLQPTRVLVVDRVNARPSIDSGSVSDIPAVPGEFEVADVRPTQPGAPFTPDRFLPGGQVEMHGWTLSRLIKLAFDLDNDSLVGAPGWLNSDRFDILAKTSLTQQELRVARDAHGLTNAGLRQYSEMLQKLLADRFTLVVHDEVQRVTVYGLTVAEHGPKLKESSSSERSMCTDTTEVGGLETTTCQNTTMAQLAPNLNRIAPNYLGAHKVVDLTGLKGAYDLTLKWHWAALIGAPPNAPPAGTAGIAPDPLGYITVFEALEKQLGLKVVQQKYPMPVVVIDRVERLPAAN